MRIFILCLSFFFMVLLSGCGEKENTQETSNQTSSSSSSASTNEDLQAKGITLEDIEGNSILVDTSKQNNFKFQGYENRVVMINFFATWCPPCKAEIPHLNKLQEKYKDRLKIISVLMEENKSNDEIMNFANEHQVQYTITNSKANYALAKKVGGVKSIPFTLLYDKDGDYAQHYMGAVPEEMMDADIQKLL